MTHRKERLQVRRPIRYEASQVSAARPRILWLGTRGMTPSTGKLAWGPEAWKCSMGTLTLPWLVLSPTPLAPTAVLGTSANGHSLAAGTGQEQGGCRCCCELGPSLVLILSCMFEAISVRQAFLCPYGGQVPCLPGFASTVCRSTVSPDAQGPRLGKGWPEYAGSPGASSAPPSLL